MAFLMRKGAGKSVVLYSRCADEIYCQAELMLLLERTPPDAKVIGDYDVDKSFPVKQFLESYKESNREQEINRMVQRVKEEGFKFEEVGVLRLIPGVDQPSPTPDEEAERIATLKETVEHYLPDFAGRIKHVVESREEEPIFILHQDAFAAGYHRDEYILLGMAVKYAGLHGVRLSIGGKNHETF
jgi:hypothetical protein